MFSSGGLKSKVIERRCGKEDKDQVKRADRRRESERVTDMRTQSWQRTDVQQAGARVSDSHREIL